MPFLTKTELDRLVLYLSIHLSMPFVEDLTGETFEQILAKARGAVWQGIRANRAIPDMVFNGRNYSIKTEKEPDSKKTAGDLLGTTEDLITARPDPSDQLDEGRKISDLGDQELGELVLTQYNEAIVRAHQWHVIAILLRLQNNREFIYFEEPAIEYPVNQYEWRSTQRARAGDRNIAGYDRATGRQKFRWTSRGKQFYVQHEIPRDSDVFAVDVRKIEVDDAQLLELFEKLDGKGARPA